MSNGAQHEGAGGPVRPEGDDGNARAVLRICVWCNSRPVSDKFRYAELCDTCLERFAVVVSGLE